MKSLKLVLKFLFGKSPNIFDNEGNVRHILDDKIWKKWEERYLEDEFNWKQHMGFQNKNFKDSPESIQNENQIEKTITSKAA